MKKIIIIFLITLLLLCGCENKNKTNNNINDKVNVNDNLELNEKEITNYLSTVKSNIDIKTKEEVKNEFEQIINFVFYGGKINNVTFNEISEKAKKEIIEYSLEIDLKIEKKWPNYKEDIMDKQNDILYGVTDKLQQELNDINNKLKDTLGDDVYNETKESVKEQTSNAADVFKSIGNEIKEISKDIVSSIKNWLD